MGVTVTVEVEKACPEECECDHFADDCTCGECPVMKETKRCRHCGSAYVRLTPFGRRSGARLP